MVLYLLLACTGDSPAPSDAVDSTTDSKPGDSDSAEEICNGLDDDGDGLVDEDAIDATPWFADSDGDGHGAGDPTLACEQPPGHVPNSDDCADSSDAVAPGATEVCGDGVDQDCDGQDEECEELGIPGAIAEFVGAVDEGLGVTLCRGTGDLTGHGTADLVLGAPLAGAGGEARVFAGPFSGQITDPAATMGSTASGDQLPRHCRVADFDGDGAADALFYGATSGAAGRGELSLQTGPVSAEMSRGTASALWAVGAGGAGSVRDLAVGDLDDDGIPDVLLGVEADDGTGGVFLLQGGTVESGPIAELPIKMELAGGVAGEQVASGDVNGDGVDDLVAFSPHNGWTLVRFGPVEESFYEAADVVAGGVQVTELVVADVNGDGYDDLLLGEYTENGSRGYVVVVESPQPSDPFNAPQEATGIIEPESGASYLATPGRLAAGDLDNDGAAEVLVAAEVFGDGGGAWTFQQPIQGNLDTTSAAWSVTGTDEWRVGPVQVVGDTDGDDSEEFLVTGIGIGEVVDQVWLLSL